MRVVRVASIGLVAYVALALAFDAVIVWRQPRFDNTAVLRTFDSTGQPHETVLSLLDDGGQLWVESGHWFRSWYWRAIANPEVELVRDGVAAPYTAVAVDTPEALDTVKRLAKRDVGAGAFWISRAMLLFAPIKPVRLDPRS